MLGGPNQSTATLHLDGLVGSSYFEFLAAKRDSGVLSTNVESHDPCLLVESFQLPQLRPERLVCRVPHLCREGTTPGELLGKKHF